MPRYRESAASRGWPPAGSYCACTAVLVAALLGLGCARSKPDQNAARPLTTAEASALRGALTTYADIADAAYSDAVSGARALEQSIVTFLAAPSAEGLAAARKAWQRARRPYQQTEVFRFYDGPIDRVELRINTWPIDEGYVEGAGQSGRLGIIDDAERYPELTEELLSTLNARDGETSISTGYHVLELLLWGADSRADGPGDRPFTDYVAQPGGAASRRDRYLRSAVALLIRDLEQVRDAWAPGRDNYRAKFLALPPSEAFGLAIKGMGSLSGPELAGERLTVAYETKAQENEHSCFSDNTVADLADDALGIQNVCVGHYERDNGASVNGPGLCAAAAVRSPELAARLRKELGASLANVRGIPAPFDQAILGEDTAPGRVAVQAASASLQAQASTLAELAAAYDVRLTLGVARRRP